MTDHGLKPDFAHVRGSATALTLPNRRMDCTIGINGLLPGAIIFLHGVNDPGATYKKVETGLCQGLNERLGRNDLRPGEYGNAFQDVTKRASEQVLMWNEQALLDDPDAYLYARTVAQATHSPFIPFYWGYRADDASIEKVPRTNEARTIRGQYQHVKGHRLDRTFAKEGGFFPNATNNIPDMYGAGFRAGWLENRITEYKKAGLAGFIADGPDRTYFLLAAHRLAMLIRTMRSVDSNNESKDPSRDTITIVGHSQGTLIALLAQALLHQQGQRCADCLILVDSPYAVTEEKDGLGGDKEAAQTSYAKVQTLIDIVNAVTEKPFELPALADLLACASDDEGRTGTRWTPKEGKRPTKEGKGLVTFMERDNRGKVYCYFCPEDTVVALSSIRGIGTFGVPETITEESSIGQLSSDGWKPVSRQLPVMAALADPAQQLRFYQRMWTRLPRRGSDGVLRAIPVGASPRYLAVREQGQRSHAGPNEGVVEDATYATHQVGQLFHINAEALLPQHFPEMYGGEQKKGNVDGEGVDHAGQVAPDRVTEDVILGNRYVESRWVPMPNVFEPGVRPDAALFKEGFNNGKTRDDRTDEVRAVAVTHFALKKRYRLERQETPREVRSRLPQEDKYLEDNNYHSAILNHTENHRWVTAMDVAIGQAVTLDDPTWRELILAMGRWRYDKREFGQLNKNKNYGRLDPSAKRLLEATAMYFQEGKFPDECIVSTKLPPLVTSGTVGERTKNRPSVLEVLTVRGKPFATKKTGGHV
jgi:hypothetical protein